MRFMGQITALLELIVLILSLIKTTKEDKS